MVRKKTKLTFEDALLELEGILEALEKGNLNLEDSITEFSRGIELYKYCYELLNKAEGKVKVILNPNSEDSKEVDFNTNT